MIGLAELFRNGTPNAAGGIRVAAIETDDPAFAEIGSGILAAEHPVARLRIPGQQPESDHAVGLAAAHGLGEKKDRRSRGIARQVPEGAVHEGQHPGREIVFLEERVTIDLALEKRIEAENGGAPIRGENRRAGCAVGLE